MYCEEVAASRSRFVYLYHYARVPPPLRHKMVDRRHYHSRPMDESTNCQK